MKPLFKKGELKEKGFDRQKVKSKVPFELNKVTSRERPEIEFSWSDRLNQFMFWLQGFVIDTTGEILKRAIPPYFWILLAVGIILIILLVVAL